MLTVISRRSSVASHSRQSSVGSRSRRSCAAAAVVLAAAFAALATRMAGAQREPLWETGTFSILGYDPQTGEVGGAVQSRVFSAGNGVLWADADVGVAATQALVDVGYGPKALNLLRMGLAPDAIIKRILAEDKDPLPQQWSKLGRQLAV